MKNRYLLFAFIIFFQFSCYAQQKIYSKEDISISISVLLTLLTEITICEAENPEMTEIALHKHQLLKANLEKVEQQTIEYFGQNTYFQLEKEALSVIGIQATKRRAQNYYSQTFCKNFLNQAEALVPKVSKLPKTP